MEMDTLFGRVPGTLNFFILLLLLFLNKSHPLNQVYLIIGLCSLYIGKPKFLDIKHEIISKVLLDEYKEVRLFVLCKNGPDVKGRGTVFVL